MAELTIDYENMPLPVHPCGPVCACTPDGAYLRVSKVGDRGDDLLSPELQLSVIASAAHAAKRRIVKIIPDIDKSGRNFAKRRTGEMATDIEARTYRQIWVYRWDRWGRNPKDSLVQIDNLQKLVGGKQVVQSATEPADTETTMGEFTRDQMLLIARLLSNMIRDSWKLTHAHRRERGLTYNGNARFGYDNTREHGYRIREDEAGPLRDAYQRIIDGRDTFNNIAAEWNALGIKTVAARRPKKPGEGTWERGTLKKMMETGFAARWIRERSNPGQDTHNTARRDSFDLWRLGAHEEIISQDAWVAFVAKLDLNRDTPPRLVWPKLGLSGMLACALCGPEKGLKLTKSNDGRRQIFVCPRRRDNKDLHRFFLITADVAEAAVLAWLDGMVTGGDDVDARAALVEAEHKTVDNIAVIDARLAEVAAESLALSKNVMKSLIPERDAQVMRADLNKQEADLSRMRAEAELARARSVSVPLPEFTGLRDAWPHLTPQDQRETLRRLVEHFVVYPGEQKGDTPQVVAVTRWRT